MQTAEDAQDRKKAADMMWKYHTKKKEPKGKQMLLNFQKNKKDAASMLRTGIIPQVHRE
jgi:hypothetical protein